MRALLPWILGLIAAIVIARVTWREFEASERKLARQRTELLLVSPILAGVALSGLLMGAWRRERVRAGIGYSSPLYAWLGKRILFSCGGTLGLIAWAPVSLPADWLYGVAVAGGLGIFAYVGNLPTRL